MEFSLENQQYVTGIKFVGFYLLCVPRSEYCTVPVLWGPVRGSNSEGNVWGGHGVVHALRRILHCRDMSRIP
jgi:hypothetical protein